jgi:hypothetical protein
MCISGQTAKAHEKIRMCPLMCQVKKWCSNVVANVLAVLFDVTVHRRHMQQMIKFRGSAPGRQCRLRT